MHKVTFSFKVSRDEEARKAGDTHELKDLVMVFSDDQIMAALKSAVSTEVIAIQANAKSHWDEFQADIKAGKFPKEMPYGHRPYGTGKRGVRKPTEQELQDYAAKRIARMTTEQIMEFAKTGKFPEGI